MPPKKFVITNHAKQRFLQRLGRRRESNISNEGIEKTIQKELTIKRIRYIIDIDDYKYVFLKNGKEYRFKKHNNTWILLTIIRHTREQYHTRVNILRKKKKLPPISFKI